MQEAFETFYQGFAGSPFEITLVALFVVLFFGGLAYFATRASRREERTRKEHANALYEELKEHHHLTPTEEDAIARLSKHLNRPERKYVLLQSQAMFNAAATTALREGAVSEGTISALRVKLDYTDQPTNKPPHSTADLPKGSAVLVTKKEQRSVKARVIDPTETEFRLQTELERRPFAFGTLVRVVYQNNIGIFAFNCAVEGFEDGILSLTHDEEPERVQRRQHYRAELHLPVHVNYAGAESKKRKNQGKQKPLESEFLDIGGGGASLRNPNKQFKAGDHIELSFHPYGNETMRVQASVIRTSQDDSVLHVSFEQMRESMRDKIYRMLFNRAKT
jgi:c-di-GMP-binding flagellar brake protein YcgR